MILIRHGLCLLKVKADLIGKLRVGVGQGLSGFFREIWRFGSVPETREGDGLEPCLRQQARSYNSLSGEGIEYRQASLLTPRDKLGYSQEIKSRN